MSNPRVSVVIPCYRHGAHADDCLGAILHQQTCRDFELVLVLDGLEEQHQQTLAWIERNRDNPQLRVLTHETNRGQTAAINTGMDAASGRDYLTWIDSDDRCLPQFLSVLVNYLDQTPEIDFAYGWVIKEKGQHGNGKWTVKKAHVIQNQSHAFLFRRAHMEAVGPHRGGFAHDIDWYWRSQEHGVWGEVSEVLMHRRVDPAGLSKTKAHLNDVDHWRREAAARRRLLT